MSNFISELKAGWVGARQREFHQRTRGIMSPEGRQALEEEFDRKMAQIQANVWDEACDEVAGQGTVQIPANPYRKEQDNE